LRLLFLRLLIFAVTTPCLQLPSGRNPAREYSGSGRDPSLWNPLASANLANCHADMNAEDSERSAGAFIHNAQRDTESPIVVGMGPSAHPARAGFAQGKLSQRGAGTGSGAAPPQAANGTVPRSSLYSFPSTPFGRKFSMIQYS
jgi:hypothetical protein